MLGRIRGLDGMRAFAVLVVIAAHAHVPFLHGGGIGVDIFFGLSGFLITYLLLVEQERFGRIDVGRFWFRRILRLLPALLLMVLSVDLLAAASMLVAPNAYLTSSLAATPGVLFYFGNWVIVATSSPALGWFGPMWSLAVEEQFYLIWPIIVILAMRAKRGLRVLTIIAVAIVAAATAGRVISFDGSNLYRTFGTDFRVDMLVMGALLAILIFSGRAEIVKRVSRFGVLPAVAAVIAAVVIMPDFNAGDGAEFQRWYYWVGLPIVGLSTATIIGFLFTHQSSRFARTLSWRPLEYTGQISYGMYLWHYPILMLIALVTKGSVHPVIWFVLGVAATYIVAAISYKFVESPLSKRFHARLRPGPRNAQIGAGTDALPT